VSRKETCFGATTTVRIELTTRERLRLLEDRLGRTTAETLELAVGALQRQLSWDHVEAHYERGSSLDHDEEAWLDQVAAMQVGRAPR
jgi:hypothetical protein